MVDSEPKAAEDGTLLAQFKEDLKANFKEYDKDGNGFLSKAEIKSFIGNVQVANLPGRKAKCDEFLEEADKDKDGKLNIDEFVERMMEPPKQ